VVFILVWHHMTFKLRVFHLWQTNFASFTESTNNRDPSPPPPVICHITPHSKLKANVVIHCLIARQQCCGYVRCRYSTGSMAVFAVYQVPYIIAIMQQGVEIRTMEPRLLIQSIDLPKLKLICIGRFGVFSFVHFCSLVVLMFLFCDH